MARRQRTTPQPLLRGWLHLACAVAAVPLGIVIVVHAAGGRARVGAAVYAIGVLAMFGVSALYHRGRWTPARRPWLKRADHSAIFVMIAGTYTPICLVALSPTLGHRLLIVVWIGAAIGVLGAMTGYAERRVIGLVAYIGLGWVAVLAVPQLLRHSGGGTIALLGIGGITYTVGAICLGLHKPDPYPDVFGYHEVWHVLVTLAVACHYLTIWSIVA
jgi:hemolysin III